MLIGYPKYKIGETVWFMSKTDQLVHGLIQLITITIKTDESNLWYSIVDEHDNQYTVREDEVLDTISVPKPKYRVGDKVSYEYLSETRKQVITEGTIGSVEIGVYSSTDPNAIEIVYYMDDDINFHVLEDEILGFAEPTIKITEEDLMCEYTGDR